ncbi:MAG: YciI family protein [Gammaproteobacteria bacterium]|nr:MAG: YciI family protein [Gammaproteobacteria bacterium]
MLYVIFAEDAPENSHLRGQYSNAHRQRLQQLLDEGRLVLAGPCPRIDQDISGTSGFTGSLIVAEFDSLDEAQQWVSEDPYVVHKIYKNVSIKPFKQVLP